MIFEKVEIIGLNHKCNVVFNLSEDCTILIGENGVGKTSALKILQFLISGMLTSVAEYVFDYIKITDNETTYEFAKEDFLVPVNLIKEKFIENCLFELEEAEKDLFIVSFDEMISEIVDRDLLGRFLDELYYFDFFSSVLNRIIEQYFEPSILFNIQLDISFKFPCYEASPIYKSDFYKKLSDTHYYRDRVILGDMVEGIRFPYKDNSFLHYRFVKGDGEIIINLESMNELKDIISNIDEFSVEMYMDELHSGHGTKIRYEYCLDHNFQDDLLTALLKNQNKEKTFDIHSAIRAQYFYDDTITEVNRIAVKGVKAYGDLLASAGTINVDDVADLLNKVNRTVIYTHEHYICPILAEELPYRFNMSKLVRQIKWNMKYKPNQINVKDVYLLQSYLEIYNELSDVVLHPENVSDAIRGFQDIISQYIDDKKVCVTPKGLNVYLEEDKEMCFEKIISEGYIEKIVFGNVDTEISINSLASGERKIIMLAFYAAFSAHLFLILDEPELSTSILWQQKILPDLLDYGQFNSIVVATHSPYIARNELLAEFIEYLP